MVKPKCFGSGKRMNWAVSVGAIVVSMLVVATIGVFGLNRHTTVEMSNVAFALIGIVSSGYFVLYLIQLRVPSSSSGASSVNGSVTSGASVGAISVGQRLGAAVARTCVVAFSVWYLIQTSVPYVAGSLVRRSANVIDVSSFSARGNRCSSYMSVSSDDASEIRFCVEWWGTRIQQRKGNLPEPGDRVLLMLRETLLGTSVESVSMAVSTR